VHPVKFEETDVLLYMKVVQKSKPAVFVITLSNVDFLLADSAVKTKSSAIAGKPCDAKASQGLLKWTWK